MHEREKKLKYAARIIEIDHGSFTSLIFSCFGGISRECSYFYKRLSEQIAEKRDLKTSEATCYIRTKISFSLIKSVVLCNRGSIVTRRGDSVVETDISLVNHLAAVK